MPRTCGESGRGLRRRDAIQLIVAEGLRASSVQVVGDGENVACVLVGRRIDKAVGDVDGVASGRRGFEFKRLESVVIAMRQIQACE